MNKNVSKYASEHWSDSDYKVRTEIAYQKSVCVATSVVRKAVLETFEKAFCLGEEDMKQKAIESYIENCEYKSEWCCGCAEAHGAILSEPDVCMGRDCPTVKQFIEKLNS